MAEAKGPTDFTGYWVLSRTEQLDEFLRALGFPWVVRKAAAKFGNSLCDVVSHTGTTVRVTSLNPKGSWTRTYDTEHPVEQLNPEGITCKTTAWWEGNVLRSRVEGSPLGICESWRYRRGDTLVVKTSVKRKDDEQEATCFWYFERMQALQRHVGGESSRAHLLKALAADHKRVQQATRKDNAYLQKVLLDWERWRSPADEFIRVVSPPPLYARSSRQQPGSSSSRLRSRAASPAGSPMGVSQSPSTSSLSGLVSSQDGGRNSRLATASPPPGDHPANNILLPTSRSAAALSALANAAPVPGAAVPSATSPGGAGSEGPSPGHARKYSIESTGPSATATSATTTTSAVAAAATAAAVASVHRKPHHYRSPSADSVNISQFTPNRGTGGAGGGGGGNGLSSQSPPTGAEALMVFKLHEFLDGRGIASVVPVTHPNDTNEPQLLGMSPEQAEETAAKLRELESDMLLRRQEHVNGWTLCCGLVLTRENDTLPDHLRVWEMTLA